MSNITETDIAAMATGLDDGFYRLRVTEAKTLAFGPNSKNPGTLSTIFGLSVVDSDGQTQRGPQLSYFVNVPMVPSADDLVAAEVDLEGVPVNVNTKSIGKQQAFFSAIFGDSHPTYPQRNADESDAAGESIFDFNGSLITIDDMDEAEITVRRAALSKSYAAWKTDSETYLGLEVIAEITSGRDKFNGRRKYYVNKVTAEVPEDQELVNLNATATAILNGAQAGL